MSGFFPQEFVAIEYFVMVSGM